MVDLRLWAGLQLRVGQDIVWWGRAQQLLGTSAAQAGVTAVGRAHSLRRAPQTPTLPTERAPGRAGPLPHRAAGHHREVFPGGTVKRRERRRVGHTSACSADSGAGTPYCIKPCLAAMFVFPFFPFSFFFSFFLFLSSRLSCSQSLQL